jgi:hypothetical protein
MSKELYKEALADAKRLRDIATKDAENALLEALAPRIKSLIDEQILNEAELPPVVSKRQTVPPGAPVVSDETCDDTCEVPVVDETAPMEECEPGAQEIDVLVAAPEVAALGNPKLGAALQTCSKNIEQLTSLAKAGFKTTRIFESKIAKTIACVENTYDYVQEVVSDLALKSKLEEALEGQYENLKQLREDAMKNRKQLTEADDLDLGGDAGGDDLDLGGEEDVSGGDEGGEGKKVELTVSFDAPGDFDTDMLKDLQVTVGDEEEEEGDDGAEGEPDGDEGGDLDFGGDAGEEAPKLESLSHLSDDTIIELDENMLRRELRRMRAINEEGFPVPSVDGNGVDDAAMDDFGGGEDDGEPLDVDVETAENQKEGRTRSRTSSRRATNESRIFEETDADTEETDEKSEKTEEVAEGLKRRLAYEHRIQTAAQSKGAQLKREGIKARKANDSRRYETLRKAYVAESRRFSESVRRTEQIKARLTEAARSNRSNSDGAKADVLRRKLEESNLDNVKLQLANKLLQMSNIPNDKKLKIVEQLDTVRSSREANLVFESATKLIDAAPAPRRVGAGSASRPTTSGGASNLMTEGFEVNRWSRLAGLK